MKYEELLKNQEEVIKLLNNAKNKGKNDTPDPEYTYRPTKLKTNLELNKDSEIATNILNHKYFNDSFDYNGKLKPKTYDVPDKYYSPTLGVNSNRNVNAQNSEINNIREVLERAGYTSADIDAMNKNEITQILNDIVDKKPSQYTRDALRIDLDDTATKIIANWDSDQYDTVETFSGGLPVKGKRSKITIDKDEQGKILIDNEGSNPAVYLELNSGTYDITKQLTTQERSVLQKNSGTIISSRARLQEIENLLENNKGETISEIYEAQVLTLEYMELKESIEQAKQSTHDLVRNTITYRNKIINNTKN